MAFMTSGRFNVMVVTLSLTDVEMKSNVTGYLPVTESLQYSTAEWAFHCLSHRRRQIAGAQGVHDLKPWPSGHPACGWRASLQ